MKKPEKRSEKVKKEAHVEAIEWWPIDKPIDDETNARVHPELQMEELRRSVAKYGQVWPILVRENGTIIAGHARRDACKLAGLTQIKVLVARGWTEQQCRAFALLDNRVPLNASWDITKLTSELKDLRQKGEDLMELGFNYGDIARLMPTDAATDKKNDAAELRPVYQVLIECGDESEQLRVLTKLQKDGITCRALIA